MKNPRFIIHHKPQPIATVGSSHQKLVPVHPQRSSRSVSAQSLESAAKRQEFWVLLEHRTFVVVWWLVFWCRGCHILFLTGMTGILHLYLHDPLLRVDAFAILHFDMSYVAADVFKWWFVGVDALQVTACLQTVYDSILARRLTFHQLDLKGSKASGQMTGCAPPLTRTLHNLIKAWKYLNINWIEPVFYLQGKHFDAMLLVHEYIEVASQLYQGYQMSVLVATRWINHLFVAMIVLNCVSTPILHHFFPATKVPMKRLIAVLVNTVFNFVNTVVIPFVIFLPYARLFDTPTNVRMNDVFYASLVRESQQLFVTSYTDFVTSWLTHWSLHRQLVCFESLLLRRPNGPHSASVVPSEVSPRRQVHTVTPTEPLTEARRSVKTIRLSITGLRHDILGVIGLLVFAIHIASQSPQEMTGCKLASTPWFTTKTSCVIMNVNCYRRRTDGAEHQISEILTQLDPHTMFQLTFSHCPRLEIPPVIREFNHIGVIDFYNCTIHQWRSDASLRADFHGELNFLWILRTRFATGIPEGLQDSHFPPRLEGITLYDTNLTTIPKNLDKKWQPLTLDVEFGQLETLPSTLVRMPVMNIIAVGNPTSSPNSRLLLNETVHSLVLSNSSLSVLPNDTLGNLDALVELMLEYTQLTEVPTYLRDWCLNKLARKELVRHSLYGSAYCNRTLESLEDDRERQYQTFVCAQDWGTAAGMFAIELIDAQRLV